MEAKKQAFIAKLHELFQINNGLDFGIYRIINEKKSDIETYINNTLPNKINKFLADLQTVSVDNTAKINELETKIKTLEELGGGNADAVNKIADIKKEISQLQQASLNGNTEEEIYDKLLTFFSRYYDEGDFISQRRYKDGVYAVPYSGEEVKLHWANHDQYYIKSSENYRDYSFDLNSCSVIFLLTDAEVERDNNKESKKKVYVLIDENQDTNLKPIELIESIEEYIDENNEKHEKKKLTLIVRFVHKTQSDMDQKKINANIIQNIGSFIEHLGLSESEQSILAKNLNKYIQINKADFFIHKDLKKFLMQELDFYIKNEVIYLQDLYGSMDNIKTLDMYVKKASVIQNIGSEIITFLAQLEDFQKALYLKKKFVTETNYCITLDKIDEKYYDEIIANQAQIEEWKKLFAIDEIKGDLHTKEYSEPLTKEFLQENEYLVLDTAFFSEEFKEKIIADIENLDEKIDGLLIHGDNFQALNLMQEKYKEQVQCVYIDPPYNTKNRDFNYKDNYKHSSWLAMMYDRLEKMKKLLNDKGVFFSSIDEYEVINLGQLMSFVFLENNIDILIWRKTGRQSNTKVIKRIKNTHEYVMLAYNNKEQTLFNKMKLLPDWKREKNNADNDPRGNWESGIICKNEDKSDKESENYYSIILPSGRTLTREFYFSKKEFEQKNIDGRIYYPRYGDGIPRLKIFENEEQEYYFDSIMDRMGVFSDAKQEINNVFNDELFDTPKLIKMIKELVRISCNNTSLILDFFAGSGTTGHAVINLNREDNGKRKYILVEMGEYFDTVTKPRIEKVIYSKDWKDGKPVSREGSSHIFKYIRLESYEDTLNNVEFSKPLVVDDFLQNEYLTKYKIQKEAENSKIYLPAEAIYNPFEFQLKITRKNESRVQKIDLIETFNFLIGLQVNNIYTKKYNAEFKTMEHGRLQADIKPDNNGQYIFKIVEGSTLKREKVLVIWRNIVGNINNNDDLNKNNAVLESVTLKNQIKPADSEYDIIYINCTNSLQNFAKEGSYKVALIEEVMKDKMFNGI